MAEFIAREFDAEGQETGTEEVYLASDLNTAVGHLLYTRRLSNGRAYVGPTGRVVHVGGSSWAISPA
jgi:hypothetical protein